MRGEWADLATLLKDSQAKSTLNGELVGVGMTKHVQADANG